MMILSPWLKDSLYLVHKERTPQSTIFGPIILSGLFFCFSLGCSFFLIGNIILMDMAPRALAKGISSTKKNNTSPIATEKTVEQLVEDIARINQSIDVTRQKIKEIRDFNFVPDLYFVLGELYAEKSRFVYEKIRQENKNLDLQKIDFTEPAQIKKQAIETYQRFIELFPKNPMNDKALFFIAHTYRELGRNEEMVKTFLRLTKDYPQSQFWEESYLSVGNFFLDQKKSPDQAMEFYQKILARPSNPFMTLARYKLGWCYLSKKDFYNAMISFEGVLTIDSKVSLNDLPDVYKKSDIRRDALTALVWPYSEQKKLSPERENALSYFEGLIPDRPSQLKVLPKLARRLVIKGRWDQALPVYFRLVEITHNLEDEIASIEGFYEALKQSKSSRSWPIEDLVDPIMKTLIRVRHSTSISNADKKKEERNFEIFLRDIATQLHAKARSIKGEEAFKVSIQAYEKYLYLFPKSSYGAEMRVNVAEAYFNLGQYPRSGYYYESSLRIKKDRDVMDSCIQAYILALKSPDKLTKVELSESREGFREVGRNFMKSYPSDKSNAMILFNMGRTYYDERDFERAVAHFREFVARYPDHKQTTAAGHLILDSYNQREDYEGLIRAGKELASNPRITNTTFKTDVEEIVQQTEFRKVQDQMGETSPQGKQYAQKLLQFASKYQGTELGDMALYEAFTSLKSKKDFKAYEPGEQLLSKHGESKYAKSVVSSMGQMAIHTADFRRAARYFEIYARKYPKDPGAPELLRTSASLRGLMGDSVEAVEDYKDTHQYENITKTYILTHEWSSAAQSLTTHPLPGIKGAYWMGLSVYRQGQVDSAQEFLVRATQISTSDYEEKNMKAHAAYLISIPTLKKYQDLQIQGRFSGGDEVSLTKDKLSLLNQVSTQMKKVIDHNVGRWTIAALYEVGRAEMDFSRFLGQISTPSGLNSSQQAQYRQMMAKQAADHQAKAINIFQSCLQNAEKFEVFSHFVRGCQSQGRQLIDESQEDPVISQLGSNFENMASSEVLSLRSKLLDNPNDFETLDALAQFYIRAQDYPMARIIYTRLSDMQKKSSEPLSKLGFVYINMNNPESAGENFHSALKMNPKDPVALYGLAALYKNFGFNNKYLELFPRLNKTPPPKGFVHEWIRGGEVRGG